MAKAKYKVPKTRVGKVFVGAYVSPALAKELRTYARKVNFTLDRYIANVLEFVSDNMKAPK